MKKTLILTCCAKTGIAEKSFRDRMLVYATYPIREQMEVRAQKVREGIIKDPMDYSLKPVYVVSMVNFTLRHQNEDAIEHGYISRYDLRNGQNGELMTDSLHFVFLELGRLELKDTEADKCSTLLERFVFSLKYMHTLKAKPQSFEDDLLNRLYNATELATMTVTTRQNYDKIMWTEIDQIATTAFAVEKAKEEGKTEEKVEVAKAMLAKKYSVKDIAEITGLSPEEIARINVSSNPAR